MKLSCITELINVPRTYFHTLKFVVKDFFLVISLLINCLFNTINLVPTLLILFYKPSILEWHQNLSSEASKVSPQLTLSFIWFLNFIFPRSASIMVLSRQWRQNSLYQLNFIPLFDDRHHTTSLRSQVESEETWPRRCKINHSHWSCPALARDGE